MHGSTSGSREANEDSIVVRRRTVGKKHFYVISICDGVGSRPGSGVLAQIAASVTADAALDFATKVLFPPQIRANELPRYIEFITDALSRLSLDAFLCTTLSVALFDHSALLVAWAGDTRLHLLTKTVTLTPVTRDHSDEEGRLTRFVDGHGHVRGGLDGEFSSIRSAIAVVASTDGIHEACTPDELVAFITFCLSQKGIDVAHEIDDFLVNNLSDNATLGITHRQLSSKSLRHLTNSFVRKGT